MTPLDRLLEGDPAVLDADLQIRAGQGELHFQLVLQGAQAPDKIGDGGVHGKSPGKVASGSIAAARRHGLEAGQWPLRAG